MIRSHILASTLLLVASPLAAQVDGRLLRPGTDSFTVSYQGEVIGRSIQVTREVTENGAAAWARAYRFQGTDGAVSWDSLWVDARTLRPLRELRGSEEGRTLIRWTPAAVSAIEYTNAGDSTVHQVELSGVVYASASFDAIARTLPLAAGMTTTIALHYPPPARTGTVTGTVWVSGPETAEVRGRGPRKAWVVSVDGTAGKTVFWVDVKDRTLLQFDTYEGMAKIEFRR
jgi:hypothetical protein